MSGTCLGNYADSRQGYTRQSFDYDVVGTLAAARYDEVDILYKLPRSLFGQYLTLTASVRKPLMSVGGRRKEDKEWTYHF